MRNVVAEAGARRVRARALENGRRFVVLDRTVQSKMGLPLDFDGALSVNGDCTANI